MLGYVRQTVVQAFRRWMGRRDLGGGGERVDIDLNGKWRYQRFDLYQKSHYHRYEFAGTHVKPEMSCGDFACGTGYGSIMLAQRCTRVIGVDINPDVIGAIKERYRSIPNVEFVCRDLLEISYSGVFDLIASFETIEHIAADRVIELLSRFAEALKPGGLLIFSVPYLQARTKEAVAMGFHQIFDIDERTIENWLGEVGVVPEKYYYQNYQSHEVCRELPHRDFVVCLARKASK